MFRVQCLVFRVWCFALRTRTPYIEGIGCRAYREGRGLGGEQRRAPGGAQRFGFRVPNFGSRISCYGCIERSIVFADQRRGAPVILGSGFRVLSFGFQVPGSGFQADPKVTCEDF